MKGILCFLAVVAFLGSCNVEGVDTTSQAPTTAEPVTTPTTAPPTTTATTTHKITTQPTTTTDHKTTAAPATTAPTTTAPTTTVPTTTAPTTTAPTTTAPTTTAPTTTAPTTTAPTTAAPTTTVPTTTDHKTTSTAAPTTTEPSHTTTAPMPDTSPVVKKYTYKSKNTTETCMIVKMKVHFQQGNKTTNVTNTAVMNGTASSCSVLVVNFGEKNSSQFKLTFESDSSSFYLSQIEVELETENLTVTATQSNLTIGKTALKSSYKCDKGFSQLLIGTKNVTIVATDIQFQAFQVEKDDFGATNDCDNSNKDLSPIIPIVVGAVLAALVLLVIIAYLIGRRRVRSGYEEI